MFLSQKILKKVFLAIVTVIAGIIIFFTLNVYSEIKNGTAFTQIGMEDLVFIPMFTSKD